MNIGSPVINARTECRALAFVHSVMTEIDLCVARAEIEERALERN
jgi:hypothetical protein